MFSLWKSSSSQKRRKFYFCIILAVAVNVSLKISCLNAGRSLFGNLLLRILLIILVTPSSVICEWFVYRLIYIYCDVFVSSLAFFLCKMNSKDLALISLSNMYLSKEDVEEANQDVLRATLPVKHKLKEFSKDSVDFISTGSIFERFENHWMSVQLRPIWKVIMMLCLHFNKKNSWLRLSWKMMSLLMCLCYLTHANYWTHWKSLMPQQNLSNLVQKEQDSSWRELCKMFQFIAWTPIEKQDTCITFWIYVHFFSMYLDWASMLLCLLLYRKGPYC